MFEALRYACWVQSEPSRTKTYAAPAANAEVSVSSPSIPVALLDSRGAPTTMVFPEIEIPDPEARIPTEGEPPPKTSPACGMAAFT